MSLLQVPKFSAYYKLQLINSKMKQETSVIFYILGFLAKENEWQRLICTSSGLRDLVVLRAHFSFVHDAARPWRTIKKLKMNNEDPQSTQTTTMDYYTQWSTRGYAHGAGWSRWIKLQTLLSIAPAFEQHCQRMQQNDLKRSTFYEKYEQLPGQPLIITDLTETWPSCPTNDETATPLQRWTMEHFLARFANEWFRFDDLHGEEISFLQYYIYTIVNRDDSPLALYDR